jgi:PAS domain S-box-containing protein
MKYLFARRNRVAWGVFATSLAMSMLVAWGLWQQGENSAEEQFELQARGISDRIELRLRRHEQILLGAAGLIDASKKITRNMWHDYVERLQLHKNYPGIQGIGYSEVIRPRDLPAHIAAVRAEGFPDYTVRPPGERNLYTSIVFLEPFIGRNLAAFGYDMFSEATRREALTRAAESGQTAMTRRVKLVQETHGKEQAGFLMYVPIYDKTDPDAVSRTADQRWQALRGFVYSPYRVNDLIGGILGEQSATLDFFIYDGSENSASAQMYSSAEEHAPDRPGKPHFTTTRVIKIYGHEWAVRLYSRPAFDRQIDSTYAWLVLLLGGGISLSLFALTTSLVNRRDKALVIANDMTMQIRQSEQRFRDIIETSPTAARISINRRVVFYNARYSALLNVSRDLAEGVDPSTYYANREVYEDVLACLGRGEQVLDRLVELHIPGAGTKWTLASYFPITYMSDPAVLGWFHDITRQRQAEEDIRHSRKLLADVLEAATISIIATDTNGLITIFNRGAERMLGYTAEEMVGRQSPAIIHLMSEVEARGLELTATLGRQVAGFRVFVELPERDGVEQREWTYVRKDGSHFPVSLVATAMRSAAGEIVGYLGIAEDITERKQAEISLQDQAQRTQAILDNVIDGIITIDGTGSISSFNRAAETIFGYSAGEVIGSNVNILMPEPHRASHDGYLHSYLTTGVARIIGIGREVEGLRRDGGLFPMDLSISEISHQGSRMFVGLVRDITERKRVDRMKSEFVSTVSHELRTPLTSISGSLGLLAGGAMGSLPEPVKALLDIAHKNSLRLSHLINDLLDMEKIAVGKMQFDMKVQPIMPLLEQAIESTRAYGAQHGVSFVMAARADHANVHVDSQRLTQILSNFLSNAAKFSPEGAAVEVAAEPMDGMLRISVTDHGAGIPATFHDRIFQKFSQADASDTRQKGGTGLGLAISRELAERMGGRVGFTSVEGQGATFFCDLPIHT